MIKTKYYSFEGIRDLDYSSEKSGKWATQLMRMYDSSKSIDKPTILELGVEKGTSTTIFLQVCEENDGDLTSVDIKDCSDVSDHEKWTFIKSDSTDSKHITKKSPILSNGIDILYIDTIHKVDHVEKELDRWFPLLNEGAYIFFDDVDAQPYRTGQRKDRKSTEIGIDKLHDFVKGFYYANEDQLYLNVFYGATGQACIHKISPRGTLAKKAEITKKR